MTKQTTQTETADIEAQSDVAEEIVALKEAIASLEAELSSSRAAQESSASEALDLRTNLDAAQVEQRKAVAKYREARLAASPEVPPDLVPDSHDIDEIDRGMDSALLLVSQVRERVHQEAQKLSTAARVPGGAPLRREPDLSSVSASEKIRIGLERLSDNSGR